MENPTGSPTVAPDLASVEGLRPVQTASRESVPPAHPVKANGPAKLDLRGMEPPRNLSEVRFEDLTIDGICGVY